MRTDVFYWKCDSPISAEQKKNCFAGEKYSERDLELARELASGFLGHAPADFEPLSNAGNHLVCRFRDAGGAYLFRADEGDLTDDDYLLAESTVMNLLNRAGLPVPPVYKTDVSMQGLPFRYQIMEWVPEHCLNEYAKAGTLDAVGIARQIGAFLARVHQFHFPGYGFFHTGLLRQNGTMQGLDRSAAEYFGKCLDRHLGYLVRQELLSGKEEERIRAVFAKGMPLLDGVQGALLHRDCAYWNILGTPERIVKVIDWDDAVSGDPADDLGIVHCFFDDELMIPVLAGYGSVTPVTPEFRLRIQLHTLRNMLWKAMIRSYMGYFEKGKDFFLSGGAVPLKEYTFRKIRTKLQLLEEAL